MENLNDSIPKWKIKYDQLYGSQQTENNGDNNNSKSKMPWLMIGLGILCLIGAYSINQQNNDKTKPT
jgi:hypothetical protein